jgi:phosphoenolpyruvate synthase/pyruvate phosphate dikinase
MYGSKFNSLEELSLQGIETPLSTALSSSLQKQFFDDNGLTAEVEAMLNSEKSPYQYIIAQLTGGKAIFPKELTSKYKEIKSAFNGESEVGIARSSAQIEDGTLTSFAGIFDSIPFDLSSEKSFIKAVLGVWLSTIKQPVIDYIVATGNHHLLPTLTQTMNVILQPALNAECAGVLFSKYNTAEEFSRSYTTYGLGELINTCNVHQCELVESTSLKQFQVSDLVYIRQAFVFTPLTLDLNDKVQTVWGECLVVERYRAHMYLVRLPKKTVYGPAANKVIRDKLLDTFNTLLKLRGGSRDFEIEWLYANDKIYVVQIRPITAFETSGFEMEGMLPIVGGALNGKMERWSGLGKDYVSKIIVTEQLSYDLISVLKECSGILTLYGTPHSHAAIICRELGVPVYKISKDQYNNFSRGQHYVNNNELKMSSSYA